MNINVEIQILDGRHGTEWSMAQYATDGSAGIDLRACTDKNVVIPPMESVMIGTGIAVQPPVGYFSAIFPRSGSGHKRGLVVGNLTGIIDNDYSGQLLVSAWNRNPNVDVLERPEDEGGDKPCYNLENTITIEPGERIAQLVFLPMIQANFIVVDQFSSDSDRGSGGFGHTGDK